MFPNPQDALPLPSRVSVEDYETLAGDLAEACASGGAAAIGAWARLWIESLATRQSDPAALPQRAIDKCAKQVDEFARSALVGGEADTRTCGLAGAQLVIARAHGFLSWREFVDHLDALTRPDSPTAVFEAAAEAIVSGDVATLTRLLAEHPDVIRARSTREHRATLLHYVSANGVEGYRQVSPKNIAELTKVLLAAGAEVDAVADVYGGGCTTLGLVATSTPPAIAGVQLPVIDVLLDHGARMDVDGSVGNKQSLVHGCLANGQPEAAAHLVARGAQLDLRGAAGLGRVDVVATFFNDRGEPNAGVIRAQLLDAFSLACTYGHANVVDFLLERGIAVDVELTDHGAGHTGLHVAAFHAHGDVVKMLLGRGARVDAIDKTWGTPPLKWALTGWNREDPPDADRYYDVVSQLVAAGATVTPDLHAWDKVRADPRMLAALGGDT